jgi:uncharacterized protein (DUF736 family)
MENIGEMTRNDNGTVTGWIAEPHYHFEPLFLARVESDDENAPDFRLVTKSPRGRDLPIGSIWQRTAKDTGETYFGGYVSTSASGYVRLRLFQSRQKSNVWNVARKGKQGERGGAQEASLPEATDTQNGNYESSFSREFEDA